MSTWCSSANFANGAVTAAFENLFNQQGPAKEALIDAQNAARDVFSRNGDTTYCNYATDAIADSTGNSTAVFQDKNGTTLSANQIAKNLQTSVDYVEVTASAAQIISNNGGLVISTWYNASGHGHVATVRPIGVAGDSPRSGRGPLINDIGGSDRVQNQSWAYRRGADVHYYTPWQ